MATSTLIVLASNGAAGGGSAIAGLLPFLLIGVVFYLLIIRPQRKRQADQQALLRRLEIGDEVVTIGGFHGAIIALTDETVDLEIAHDVVVTLARSAVARTLTPHVHDQATIDALDEEFDDSIFDDGDIGDMGDSTGDNPDAR